MSSLRCAGGQRLALAPGSALATSASSKINGARADLLFWLRDGCGLWLKEDT